MMEKRKETLIRRFREWIFAVVLAFIHPQIFVFGLDFQL